MAKKGNMLYTVGKGSVLVHFVHDGKLFHILMDGILHVPDLMHNLVSLARLIRCSMKLVFEDNTCILSRDKVVFAMAATYENQWIM